MGLDVNLYAVGTPTHDQLAAADRLVRERSTIAGWDGRDGAALVFDATTFDEPRVELQTLSRYFGPGYPRGNWPAIEEAIEAMRAAFPRWRLYYGSDSNDDGELITDRLLDEHRALWRSITDDTNNTEETR